MFRCGRLVASIHGVKKADDVESSAWETGKHTGRAGRWPGLITRDDLIFGLEWEIRPSGTSRF